MNCGCMNSIAKQAQSHHGCCCGSQKALGHGLWSKKKKIRVLEARLKELNEQKTDLEDLIEEIKGDS